MEYEECQMHLNDSWADNGIPQYQEVYLDTFNGGHLYYESPINDNDYYDFNLYQDQKIYIQFRGSEANEKINGYQIVIFNSNVYVEYFSNPCDLFQDSIELVADNYKILIQAVVDSQQISCSDSMNCAFKLSSSNTTNCSVAAQVNSSTSCTNNSIINVTIESGSEPFSYLWSNGSTNSYLDSTSIGQYTVSVTDAYYCVGVNSINIVNSCTKPNNIYTDGVTSTSATLNWGGNSCSDRYRLQYRLYGTTNWQMFILPFSSYTLTDLIEGATYQYRVRSVCSEEGSVISPWSNINTFTTIGLCTEVANISTQNLNGNNVKVFWAPNPGAYAYRLRYRLLGSTTWTTIIVNGNLFNKTINGLFANSTYELQMRSQCSPAANVFSPYSPVITFTTPALREEESTTEIFIYPNPNNGNFIVDLNNDIDNISSINIISLTGTLIKSFPSYSPQGLKLNGELSAGVYFIQVQTPNSTYNKMFIVR